MLAVPSQRAFSNPMRSLPRILNVFDGLIDIPVKTKGAGKRGEVLKAARIEAQDSRIGGSMAAYRMLQRMLFSKLGYFEGADLYVLPGVSPNRTPVYAQRFGVDIFHPMHYIAEHAWLSTVDRLLAAARQAHPSTTIENLLGRHAVTSGNITDWFAENREDERGVKFQHPFMADVHAIESSIDPREGFGSLERRLNDAEPKQGNAQYSDGILSFGVFRSIRDAVPDVDLDLIAEAGSREEFYQQARMPIQLIRLAMIEKVSELILKARFSSVNVYAMLTSTTADIWKNGYQRARQKYPAIEKMTEFRFIGGGAGPMQNTDRTGNAELHPSAIRLLEGAIMNRYAQATGGRIRAKPVTAVPEAFGVKHFGHCPYGSPWLLCNLATTSSGPNSCLKSEEEKLPESGRFIMEKFAKENNTGILPVEGIIYLLNHNDYPLATDPNHWLSWRVDTAGKTLVPLPFERGADKPYDIRASELPYPLTLEAVVTKTKSEIEGVKQQKFEELAEALQRGTIVHKLMFEGSPEAYADLLHPEFQFLRGEYCDSDDEARIQLLFTAFPRDRHFRSVDAIIERLESRITADYGTRVVNMMRELLDGLQTTHKGIVISGHPDAMTQLYSPDKPQEEWDVAVIDGKTSLATPHERRGITRQLLTYGIAGVHKLQRTTANVYTIPVFTRFNQNRLMPEEERDMTDYGGFLKQKIMPRKISLSGERIDDWYVNVLSLHIAKQVLAAL